MTEIEKDRFEHEVRNAMLGVALEVRRILQAMGRLEKHLIRMNKACGAGEVECEQITEEPQPT